MKSFNDQLKEIGEWGVVEQVLQSIAIVSGLPGAKMHEIILFESGHIGEVFLVNRHDVEILVLTNEPLKRGVRVTRTNKALSVPVGEELLGEMIDPLGNPITNVDKFVRPKEEKILDSPPPSMATRATIKTPMVTGTTIIDMMIPLGKGQRELIIGDRKTGKSSFVLAALKSQISLGSIGIYGAVGRKKSDLKLVEAFLEKEGIRDRCVIVATTTYDSPAMIYQTPYAAMTIAEHFMYKGNDVLVILDDLSTHAKFYREVSLLAKRFPGRDAYPGDIFYTHARLVERAGNYKHKEKGEVSTTCLPLVEIVEGDFTGYIATNLMGMTDGHIFFDSNVYFKGRRPAVNLPLSVTRVGRQAQTKTVRNLSRELTTFLAHYEKMAQLAQFGAELTPETKVEIRTGDVIYKLFEQPVGEVIPQEIQIVMLCLAWLHVFNEDDLMDVLFYRAEIVKAFKDDKVKKYLAEVVNIEKFEELIANVDKNREKIYQLMKKPWKPVAPVPEVPAPAPVAAAA